MTLYRWTSELLRAYASGDIVVAASSVDEARTKATGHFAVWLAEEYEWLIDLAGSDVDDGMFIGQLDNLSTLFRADIANEPEVLEGGCIFIGGGS